MPLLEKAKRLHKIAFKKESWNRERYKRKTGSMLQNLFGIDVWTLEDLNQDQLEQIVTRCEKKIDKKQL